jgi:hypothetical protein
MKCGHCQSPIVFRAGSWIHVNGLRLTCEGSFRKMFGRVATPETRPNEMH